MKESCIRLSQEHLSLRPFRATRIQRRKTPCCDSGEFISPIHLSSVSLGVVAVFVLGLMYVCVLCVGYVSVKER